MPNYLGSYEISEGREQAFEIFAPSAQKAEQKAKEKYGPSAYIGGTLFGRLADIPHANTAGEKNG